LIHELAPTVAVGAILINPTNPVAESVARDAREAARSLGLQFHVLNASTDQDIDSAFAGLIQQRIGLLLVMGRSCFPRWAPSTRSAGGAPRDPCDLLSRVSSSPPVV